MSKFFDIILKKLEENNFMYAEKLLNDKINEPELKQCVRDLVPVLLQNVGKNIDDDKNDLMVCSVQLLEIIAHKADPEETVLEFLEQMDNADCIKFSFILKLLLICLERCTENKMRYIETCLVTIRSCLEDVIQFEREFVVEDVYEDEIRARVKDISLVLESVLDFYGKFINKVSAKATGYNSDGFWYSVSWKKTFSSNQDFSFESNYSQNSGTGRIYEDDIRSKILEASLPFVNKYGWTKAAVNDGAASIGYPGIIHGIFPNPSVELINYFNEKCNSELNESLNKSVQSVSDLADTKKFIEHAFQLRLRMIIPYIEKWPQALAIMSVPNNVPTAFKTFSSLIDDVCYLSGDKSVDFNWYSRRAALALIYKTTELCMIQDKTVDYMHTWKFLERRVDEAFKVDEVIRFNNNIVNTFKDITTASFRTLANIIGLNH